MVALFCSRTVTAGVDKNLLLLQCGCRKRRRQTRLLLPLVSRCSHHRHYLFVHHCYLGLICHHHHHQLLSAASHHVFNLSATTAATALASCPMLPLVFCNSPSPLVCCHCLSSHTNTNTTSSLQLLLVSIITSFIQPSSSIVRQCQ